MKIDFKRCDIKLNLDIEMNTLHFKTNRENSFMINIFILYIFGVKCYSYFGPYTFSRVYFSSLNFKRFFFILKICKEFFFFFNNLKTKIRMKK